MTEIIDYSKEAIEIIRKHNLNIDLLIKNKVTEENILKMDDLYKRLNDMFNLAEEILKYPKNSKEFKTQAEFIGKEVDKIESELQKLWNFEHNEAFYTYWNKLPICECPILDNVENYGYRRIINCSCPAHSFLCKQIKENEEKKETLADRIKRYEKESEYIIPNNKHLIIRIDGHKFSKFTKGLNKPFDEIFTKAMVKTTMDLVERFSAYTGYTQSDEITLYIPTLIEENSEFTHIFGGRTQKIASLAVSFVTMRFNKNFKKIAKTVYKNYIDIDLDVYKNKFCNAYFDARVFGVVTKEEVFNSFLFRFRDCIRNSKQQFARSYCSHKELLNKTSDEVINYCKEKTGMIWEALTPVYKYGAIIKRKLYKKKTKNGEVTRSKLDIITKEINEFNEENLNLITSKYIN